MRTTMTTASIMLILITGCSDPSTGPGPEAHELPTIELRASHFRIEAIAGSEAQVWITAIWRDVQGVARPGEEIYLTTKPEAKLMIPAHGLTDANGKFTSRLLLHVPPDTSHCTVTAFSGSDYNSLTLTLIGE